MATKTVLFEGDPAPVSAPIYLDNHATTACDPAVVEAMLPYFAEKFGNAGSGTHAHGWAAARAVERSRQELAALLGGEPEEIVFTSGATEALNLAIRGVAARHSGGRLLASAVEHPAVLDTCRDLGRRGFEVVVLPVDSTGRLSPQAVEEALTDDTILVAVMAANNEVGTLQPLAEVGALLADHPAAFLVDAAQAAGRVALDAPATGADLLAISAHKMHGPKGVGALWLRRRPRVRLVPQQTGGGQEGGLRPGTLNVPGIVGLGAAARVAAERLEGDMGRIGALRDALQAALETEVGGLRINGHPVDRLPGNLSVSFEGVDGDALIAALQPRISVSAGAACGSGAAHSSPVLRALGLPDDLARCTIRFGFARFNDDDDVRVAAEAVREAVARLRREPALR